MKPKKTAPLVFLTSPLVGSLVGCGTEVGAPVVGGEVGAVVVGIVVVGIVVGVIEGAHKTQSSVSPALVAISFKST